MGQGQSLIAELEDAIQSGSKDKRIDTLRRITDLFVADADRLNDQQIDVFDDVLNQLIKRIEGRALAEPSERLCRINNAPMEAVRRLARDDDITVAQPVLTQSRRLTLPDHFILLLSSMAQVQRQCLVVWRAEGAVGVEFIPSAAPSATSSPSKTKSSPTADR